MLEYVNERVDIGLISRKGRGVVAPFRFRWKSRDYTMIKIGSQHPKREGQTLFHIIEGTDGTTFFRIRLNTDTLQAELEAIADGLPG